MTTSFPRRKSPRQAIAAHCRSCVYDPAMPGTWKMQTEACTVKTCELYEFRPHSKRKRDKTDEQVHTPAQAGEPETVSMNEAPSHA
ncbi:MAG TPA: hypothetical protein DCZ48_13915 [Methylococcaceae bacterium]|nr:hypothetical protein [Methylococcaceae bacterium]